MGQMQYGPNARACMEAITEIQQLKKFWNDVRIPGAIDEMNPELDKAGRVVTNRTG